MSALSATVTTTQDDFTSVPCKQPDISYHPDHTKYLQRTARRLAENPNLPKTPLPEGFPERVDGPIVWEGKDWKDEDQWVYHLSQAELKEINDALTHFNGEFLSSATWILLIYR
jgi:hypothetical protein